MSPPPPLFEPTFLRELEQLSVVTRGALRGPTQGARRAPGVGTSVEFADYRSYSPGDDYRRIDWNAYARLDRLFLRLFRAEHNLRLSLLLDCSASMAFGEPTKARLAAQLAGALAFIGLRDGDSVGVAACRAGQIAAYLPPVSHQAAVWRVWRFLTDQPQAGTTNLTGALRAFGQYGRLPGLSVLISDLLTPLGYRDGIDALLALNQEVILVQVLAPDEADPPLDMAGDWRLLDAEDGSALEVSLTASTLRHYRERLAAYTNEIGSFCRGRGVHFVQLRSDMPIQAVIVRTLRGAGVLA